MIIEPVRSDGEQGGDKPAVVRQVDDTLVPLLHAEQVSMEVLHQRYGALLELVRTLIGVVPNCDRYLEIWPPAFRTYNVMVPNFLNLPFSLFGLGAAPKELLGLGMYVASRAAECPYCSAHCCSFALRRGTSQEKLDQALVPGSKVFTDKERAILGVAQALGRVPCQLTDGERRDLEAQLGPEAAEWLVFGMVMMGFLNKFMDAIGVELEQSTFAEVRDTMGAGWDPGKAGSELDRAASPAPSPARDSLWTKLRLIPLFPGALRLDARWQRGVPNRWPAVGEFLRAATGHDFPVLSRIQARRCIRAVATMLRDNLDPATSVTGLRVKVLSGVIFGTVIADAALSADVRALGPKLGVSEDELDAAMKYATDPGLPTPGKDALEQAILRLTLAASPSPARITPEIVDECRRIGLSAAAIVELISWLSVLQMLHRLSSYFAASN